MAEDCGRDEKEQIRETVREGYGQIARTGGSCCPSSCCGSGAPEQLARGVGYSEADLAVLPEGANMGLSCGNPTAIASLRPGEVVLDLGSGGGFDVFIAGPKVGPSGRVIGVDMTPDMVSKARQGIAAYKKHTGLDNVEFRLGEIEHLPAADNSVDLVISNCVLNLSPDKPAGGSPSPIWPCSNPFPRNSWTWSSRSSAAWRERCWPMKRAPWPRPRDWSTFG